ncbi:MAG: sensor histidine kinase, partial [Enterovirga sp.]|nr:sensor histidine kinase [Enterovirga sp.]
MTKGIEAAVAALSGDPALAGSLGTQARAVAWDRRAERVLWTSPAARDFARLVADEEGRLTRAFPGHARLAALAGGLAPRAGMRIERIRFSDAEAESPAELACRLLDVDDETVLLTVFNGDLPARVEAGQDARAAAEPQPAPFVERVRRQGRRRFIWSMDREGRFLTMSQPLADVVGPESAEVVGLSWAEVVESFAIDGEGRIGEAIASRATWSDETVLWRIADTSYAVPVDLGGMPIFGRGHEFEGFRGFGLCR